MKGFHSRHDNRILNFISHFSSVKLHSPRHKQPTGHTPIPKLNVNRVRRTRKKTENPLRSSRLLKRDRAPQKTRAHRTKLPRVINHPLTNGLNCLRNSVV
jgi:hypothetical protein